MLTDLGALPGYDILVVDDGSADRTTPVALRAGVAVVTLPFNLGIGGALRCGFRYAVERGYERAVQFDADGQHEIAELDSLLQALDRGADLVIGSRFAKGSSDYDVGRTRGGAMGALRVIVKLLSGRSFTDTSSGFRAFSREMVEYFSENYPAEYMESVEALLLALYGGFRVAEVPVAMHAREVGAPSAVRFRLAYHYVRVVLVLLVKMRRRPREQLS